MSSLSSLLVQQLVKAQQLAPAGVLRCGRDARSAHVRVMVGGGPQVQAPWLTLRGPSADDSTVA